MSDTVREDLQHRSEAIYSLAPSRQIAASMMNDKPLPEEIHTYHSFVPLEPSGPVQPTAIFSGIGASGLLSSGPGHVDPSGQFIPAGHFGHHGIQAHHQQQLHQSQSQHPRRKWFLGFPSIVYKATNRENGGAVALRRIEGAYSTVLESEWLSIDYILNFFRIPLTAGTCIFCGRNLGENQASEHCALARSFHHASLR